MYVPRGRGVDSAIHFHRILHAKNGRGGGGGVQIACMDINDFGSKQ